jgi:hypothetical protein
VINGSGTKGCQLITVIMVRELAMAEKTVMGDNQFGDSSQ